MTESLIDKHYEEKFEFPLLKAIIQRAEEKDISIRAAAEEVVPEYAKDLKWRDDDYNQALAKKQQEEKEAARAKQSKTD